MSIYTIEDLREVVPLDLKNWPDDVLLCDYSRRLGESGTRVFDYMGVEYPSFFSCDQLLSLYSYHYPAGEFSVGIAAGLGGGAAIFLYRFITGKINKSSQFALGVRLASIGGALSIILGTFSLFKHSLITALSIYFVWTLVTVPALFVLGYLYELIRRQGVTGLIQKAKSKLFKVRKQRESRDVWLKVSDEIDGGDLDRALWTQCLAQARGDEAKAKSDYMIKRYDQLAEEGISGN